MAHARCAPAPSSRSRRRSPGNRCSGSNCRRDARESVAGSATTPVSADPAPPSTFPACKSRIATHCDRETQPAGRRSRRCRTILRWFRPTRCRACTARVRQDRTISPFTRTVQAPQTPCSQPTCVPVRCRCSRRKSARLRRGRTCATTASPLTWSEIAIVVVTRALPRQDRDDQAPLPRNGPAAVSQDAGASTPTPAGRRRVRVLRPAPPLPPTAMPA